jgi:hypothetical protein
MKFEHAINRVWRKAENAVLKHVFRVSIEELRSMWKEIFSMGICTPFMFSFGFNGVASKKL